MLMEQPGVGPGTAIALARHFPTWDALRDSSPAERRTAAGKRAEQIVVAGLPPTPVPAPDGVIGYFDVRFPRRLLDIPSPPAVLWVRGELPAEEARAVAIVGTRKPTTWGVRTAERSVEALEGTGSVIVSGLALGIDGIAHRRALTLGLPTVAVLGSGVDRPTPAEHAQLAAAILEAGGSLIAEVPPGTTPSARTLVARNRLQSGLSDTVVVAQCGLGSGTLHTARFALLQGRELIVPEPTGDFAAEPQSAGNIALARESDFDVISASAAERRRVGMRSRLADSAPKTGEELAEALLNTGPTSANQAPEPFLNLPIEK